MPILKNTRHELFCQKIASGENGTKAYKSAGYSNKGAGQAAEKLLKKDHIQDRITELCTKIAEVCVIDRARVLERLSHLSKCAEGRRQFMAAIRAEELIGKAIGMFDGSVPQDPATKPTAIQYRWAQPEEFAGDALPVIDGQLEVVEKVQ